MKTKKAATRKSRSKKPTTPVVDVFAGQLTAQLVEPVHNGQVFPPTFFKITESSGTSSHSIMRVRDDHTAND